MKAQLATLSGRFGRSSEKLDRLIEQIELTITDLEETETQAGVEQRQDCSSLLSPTVAAKMKSPLGRKPLPPTCRARRSPIHVSVPDRSAAGPSSARSV
ncbi:transposase [Ensifer sp. ENS02]|uniref:transposase n=1 Tax=Ensifer sp. ENS02 TaxID=2769290 RepID=UPI001AEF2E04|nr:transposase [Ensifer sp. ENS02]